MPQMSAKVDAAAYEGPGYKEALRALGEGAAERDMRIIEGVD